MNYIGSVQFDLSLHETFKVIKRRATVALLSQPQLNSSLSGMTISARKLIFGMQPSFDPAR
jgi:hypothetical protein